PGAVGVARAVPDVDEVLVGEQVDDGAGDGEPAEAGVEHADRPGVHRRHGSQAAPRPLATAARRAPLPSAAVELWHNPRCSKSRAAKAILDERGVAYAERRYLDDPPTAEELDRVLTALGKEPWEVARLGEQVAADL